MAAALVVTEDPALIEMLAVISDRLRVPLMRTVEPRQINRLWLDASAVVIGDDSSHLIAGAMRRPNVVLVVRDMDDATVWERAVTIGAASVLWLPDHLHLLLGHLAATVRGRTA